MRKIYKITIKVIELEHSIMWSSGIKIYTKPNRTFSEAGSGNNKKIIMNQEKKGKTQKQAIKIKTIA